MWIIATALLIAAEDKKADVDAAELKKFAGTWAVTAREHGGKKQPKKQFADQTLTFAGAKFTYKDGDDVLEQAEVVALDPGATPGTIDVKITSGDDKGKVTKAIYKFDGDKLTLCIAEPGKDRPKGFDGQSGTGQALVELTRKKK